jgi:hypothetical protein
MNLSRYIVYRVIGGSYSVYRVNGGSYICYVLGGFVTVQQCDSCDIVYVATLFFADDVAQ